LSSTSATRQARSITLRHSSATTPQREFWASAARYRAFVGGVGSGKSRAGAVEALRMPAGTVGMVLAPTYPMLRDATLRSVADLAQRGGIVTSWHRTEMRMQLVNGSTILFRSADDPDRLRGPNLAWFWLDEAAMMAHDVWLIMLGRLRAQPGRAWVTTTPRGRNWVHDVWRTDSDDYALIRSSSRDNPYLPSEFVTTLESQYTSEFAAQEIDGEFVDPSGAMFQRAWFSVVDAAPDGLRWVRYWDLAASTKTSADYTASVAVAMAPDGVLYLRDMVRGRWEWPEARQRICACMLAEPRVVHAIEQAMHGLAAIQELRRDPALAAITMRGVTPDRDKIARAMPWAARAEAGKVRLVAGAWVREFLDEVTAFPSGRHDDQVDSVSGALPLLRAAEFRGVR
jgi:predicted phage terminase large subunit-like protein